jgi:hypothetical protein
MTVIEPIESTMAMQTSQAMPVVMSAMRTTPTGSTMTTQMTQAVPAFTLAAQTSQASPNTSNQGFFTLGTSRRTMQYGMPTSLMQGLHTNPSSFSESLNVPMPQLFAPGVSVPIATPQQSLTNASMMALRQQMDEANHDMANLVTQQMGAITNPLIRDTNNSYQALSAQMEWIADFFGAPAARSTPVTRNLNGGSIEPPTVSQNAQVPENQMQPPMAQAQMLEEPEKAPIFVNRNQDADQVVMQAVETIMRAIII